MHYYQPFSVIGFHSCTNEVGLKILNWIDEQKPCKNTWDWLGIGSYFWELNPLQFWEYAKGSTQDLQIHKIPIQEPFVLGAIIDLGNCFNLLASQFLEFLRESYLGLRQIFQNSCNKLPINKDGNPSLDCSIIDHIHDLNLMKNIPEYDTIQCAFSEAETVYATSDITKRLHIQLCVRNIDCIKGFFLPRPIEMFYPTLKQ